MRRSRFIFMVLAATVLAASCDPSAFGPSGTDSRSMAVNLSKVSAELSRSGFQLTLPGPFDLKPASIARTSAKGVEMMEPPPAIIPVSAKPNRFNTLSTNILLKSGELAGLFGAGSARAQAVLDRAGITDVLMSLTGVTVKDAGKEFHTDKIALSLLSESYLEALAGAADSADGEVFLLGGVVECRGATFRMFFTDSAKFNAARDELVMLFGASNDFEKIGRKEATLSVISGKPMTVAVKRVYGEMMDKALVMQASSPAYTIRMSGIDDYGYAFVNDQEILSGIDDDSGETSINAYLKPGENRIVFQLVNDGADLAYRVSVSADGRGVDWAWEKACGVKGVKGCSRQKGMFEEKCVVVCDGSMRCRIK
ncbi:MAG: hypothetical protein HZB23_09515 [Deltaproteobacteria bacterium]|nr:hypothetical protein [Deltaproteobacteria bacterium]